MAKDDYSKQSDLRQYAMLSPAEQEREYAFEQSPGNRAEFEQAIASEKNPASKAILLEQYAKDFGGARAPVVAQAAPQGGLSAYLDSLDPPKPSKRASLSDYLDFLDNQSAKPEEKKPGAFERAAAVYNDPEGGVVPAIGSLLASALPSGGKREGAGSFLKDTALDAAQGVVGLGESAIGLGDIATMGMLGKGLAALGYEPKQTSEFLSGLQTDERQQSNREVQDTKGFFPILAALGTHPSVLIGDIVQALPGTIGVGAAAGQLIKRLAATAAVEAKALGYTGDVATKFIAGKVKEQTFKIAAAASGAEGAQTAGSIAEAGRQSGKDWSEYVGPAIAGGLGTAAIGMVSGKIGQKLGIGDMETDIAARSAGVKGAGIGQGGVLSRTGKEMAKEGFLEEMPQSYQEKAMENLATGRPWDEGTTEAAARGLVSGAAMAGGHSVLSGRQPKQEPKLTDPIAEIGSSTSVDEAITKAADILAGTNPQPTTLGTQTNVTAGPGFDVGSLNAPTTQGILSAGQQANDQADLDSLIASETRDLQVIDANRAQERQKQAELDQIQSTGTGQYGIAPEARPAVEQAATVEAPTAMQLALEKARLKAMRPTIPEVPAVAPEAATPVAPQTETAPPHPNAQPGDITRNNGIPYQTENGARLRLSEVVKKGGTGEVVQIGEGAFVVRPKESNAKTPETVQVQPQQQTTAPDAIANRIDAPAEIQPAASGVPVETGAAQPGNDALNGNTPAQATEIKVPERTRYLVTKSPAYEGVEPLSAEDADFELEALENSANKGRLTPAVFAGSEIGKRLDAGTIIGLQTSLKSDPVGTIQALRKHIANKQAANVQNPAPAANQPAQSQESQDAGPNKVGRKDSAQIAQPVPAAGSGAVQAVDQRLVPKSKREDLGHLGRDSVPLTEGGKPFKTNKAAKEAKKNQPTMRVIRVEGGFALAPKTEAQIAAEARNARRLAVPRFGNPGVPLAAHEFVASRGGLRPNERSDMGIQGNVRVGNRFLFAGTTGMDMDSITEALKEAGYLRDSATHDDARNLIKRSLNNPQYTPEGTEKMAEREIEAQRAAFEAEQEAIAAAQEAEDNELDMAVAAFERAMDEIPKGLAQSDMSMEDALLVAGYTQQEIDDERSQNERAEADQGPAEAAPGESAQSDRGREGAQSQDSPAGSEEGLTSPTRADVLKQQADAEAEAKRKEDGGDKPLPRRELTGDVPDMFNPQGSVFDQPAEPEEAPAAEPDNILPVGKTKQDLQLIAAGKYLSELTNGSGNIYALSGRSNIEQRVKLMAILLGKEKVNQADAGVTAIRDEFYKRANIDTNTTPRNAEIAFGKWVDSLSDAAAPAAQATEILNAANITGKERIDALKDVKSGTITPDELKEAYPAKEEAKPLVAKEPEPTYSGTYETDLFGNPIPTPTGGVAPGRSKSAGVRGNVQPESSVSDTPAPSGDYYVNTLIASETKRELGASLIRTPVHAAQATQYLYKSAVERFDGIVTDKNGKPLAVVGGFKGAISQASVYPGTIMAEAIRIPGAANIWFSHNHPSGKSMLSAADKRLNETMTDVFRGSGIEPMGLLAVAGNDYSYVDANGSISNDPIPTAVARKSVPVMERQLADSSQAREVFSDPASARQAGRALYAKAKEPGIMLMDAQMGLAAWIPITKTMMGPLRGTGGAAAVYRAVSQSNASNAIIIHGGELDYAGIGNYQKFTPSENIAAALRKVDVSPLDSINVVTGKSQAEQGRPIADGPMFSRADNEAPKPQNQPTGTTVANLKTAIKAVTGIDGFNKLGRIVATTAADIKSTWEPLIGYGVNLESQESAGKAQAFYDPKSKTVFLIADNIREGDEAAVLAHELIHKWGKTVLGEEGWNRLHDVINSWKDAPTNSDERTVYDYARRHVEAVGMELSSEEMFPYAVEAAIKMGIKPSMAAKKGTVARWLESVKQNLAQVWAKVTGKPETFKAQDLVNLAFGIAQLENPEMAGVKDALAGPTAPDSGGAQTDTPAFKAWFGDSKVVDADGKPLASRSWLVLARKSAMSESRPDSDTGNAKPLADLLVSKTFSLQGLGGLEVPSQREVLNGVIALGDDLKVLRSVVELIPVDVVNILSRKNVAPEMLFSDKAMLKELLSIDSDGSVSTAVKVADALVVAVARMATKGTLIDASMAASNGEKNSASNAGVSDGFHSRIVDEIKPIGNNGTFDGTNPDIRFSRSTIVGQTLQDAGSLNNPRGLVNAAVEHLNDRFNAPGTLNWWQKSIGTQYDLAQRSKPFKKVFDSVQNFINDTSYYATEAADLAPKLVPKLESWKDIVKKPISSADSKAIATPIFEGTLIWGRDENGKLTKVTGDQPAGVVFTNQELKTQFGLTPEQIELYREFRTATDKSLTNLVVSHMVKLGGTDVAPIADMALQAKNATEAGEMLSNYLVSLAENDEARSDVLMSTAAKVTELADKANDLTGKGYAPLSRFGHYTVDVISDGQRVYFGMFESKIEANQMAKRMQENYPKSSIRQGTVSEEEYKLFAGVTPETLELFGEMLGLDSQGSDAKNQVFQEYLKAAKSNRSAMKRLIHRKGIAGFSEDASRVLAGFIYSNARQTSANLHAGEITKATSEIPQGQGEVKDAAIKLATYVQNPQEEAQALRGLMFAQYIGGSVASAMVNLTQPFTMTLPWLSQYGGIAKAGKQMAAATRDALKDKTGDAKLDAALKHAEEEGIVSPQEVHQLQQQASGAGSLKSGDGTKLGDAKALASNSVSRVMLGWGKLFGVAEQFNRRSTFIAAYRTAVEQGMDNPAQFAERAIAETQGIYNKGNKPAWARGAVGSTIFTFKQFSVAYLEMIGRMVNGPEANTASRMAALNALAILVLVAGVGGLPGADDLDDLISGILQSMGYNFDSKAKRRAFLMEHLGAGGQRFVEHGLSGLPGVPIDVSGRLGLGNLIPGTGLFTKKKDHTSDVAELAGPAGDLFRRGFQAGGALVKGDVGEAVNSVAPMAARNVVKAFDMANMGMYRDQRGNKVIDTDMVDAAFKGIGFQPAEVKQVQDATGEIQRMVGLNKMRESEIADKWAQGLFEKNPEKAAEARQELLDWNAANPDMRIKIDYSQIFKRLKAMNQTKAQRIEKTAPKEIRAAVRQELMTQ